MNIAGTQSCRRLLFYRGSPMKFWTDGYDTYAAEMLEDVKQEQIAQNIINEEDFYYSEWKEVSGNNQMWCCSFKKLNIVRLRDDEKYNNRIKKKCVKTLTEAFDKKRYVYKTKTGKSWFMCTVNI